MEANSTYEELARRLTELEQIFRALQSHEVDAIVGSRSVLMLRIREAEENLRRQREDLETLLEDRSALVEELRTHQIELEEQAEELRQTQERAREARDRYLDLYDHAPVGYLTMKKDGFIIEANLTAARLLGVERPQLVHSRLGRMIAPDSQDDFYFHTKRIIETGHDEKCDVLVSGKDGRQLYFQLTSMALNPGARDTTIRSTLTDITDRRRAEGMVVQLLREREEQLKKSQSNFELLVSTMAEGVIVVDRRGHVQFANPAAATAVNLPEKELVGYRFGVPSTLGFSERVLQVDDQTRVLELNTARTEWNGEEGYLVTLQDATMRRHALERVKMLSQRLIGAQEKERRAIGLELHDEIGGALTGVKLALARSEKRLGEDARSELQNVGALLDETMDLVSTLSGKMRPSVLYDFGLVEALKLYFERYTRQTGIKICFKQDQLDSNCSDIVETTAYRIIQESLTNVARHARAKKATVLIRSDSEKLYVQVEDRGCGFDPLELDVAPSGINGMQDRALVAGGDLVVDSSPGRGTCVSCELPLTAP